MTILIWIFDNYEIVTLAIGMVVLLSLIVAYIRECIRK